MNRSHGLTLLDRLEYGAISAFFGLLVGGLMALIAWWFLCSIVHACQPFNAKLVEFSVVYFLVVGVGRGVEAAETIAVGLIAGVGGALAAAATEMGGVPTAGGNAANDRRFAWESGVWWSVLYFVSLGLIAWLAPGR